MYAIIKVINIIINPVSFPFIIAVNVVIIIIIIFPVIIPINIPVSSDTNPMLFVVVLKQTREQRRGMRCTGINRKLFRKGSRELKLHITVVMRVLW